MKPRLLEINPKFPLNPFQKITKLPPVSRRGRAIEEQSI